MDNREIVISTDQTNADSQLCIQIITSRGLYLFISSNEKKLCLSFYYQVNTAITEKEKAKTEMHMVSEKKSGVKMPKDWRCTFGQNALTVGKREKQIYYLFAAKDSVEGFLIDELAETKQVLSLEHLKPRVGFVLPAICCL